MRQGGGPGLLRPGADGDEPVFAWGGFKGNNYCSYFFRRPFIAMLFSGDGMSYDSYLWALPVRRSWAPLHGLRPLRVWPLMLPLAALRVRRT
mmetsp:Transcript_57405/g.168079  ORF Transcript_57405/g.168079 Transcript_57405/m.168079 type:complete len:92 (-) Transcript_57405:683-958(-)